MDLDFLPVQLRMSSATNLELRAGAFCRCLDALPSWLLHLGQTYKDFPFLLLVVTSHSLGESFVHLLNPSCLFLDVSGTDAVVKTFGAFDVG